MGWYPCATCCNGDTGCAVATEDWSGTLSNWTSVSGTNVIASGQLKQTGSGCLIVNNATITDSSEVYVKCTLDNIEINAEVRVICKYKSSTDYLYGYVKRTGSYCYEVGIGDSTGSLKSKRFLRDPTYGPYGIEINVCYHNGVLQCVYGVDVQQTVTDNGGNQAGLYASSGSTEYATWGSFYFGKHQTTTDTGCLSCGSPVDSCNIVYERWRYNDTCNWTLISGTLPTIDPTSAAGGEGAQQKNDCKLRFRKEDPAGASSHRNGVVYFYPAKVNQTVQLWVAADSTLSTGVWIKAECTAFNSTSMNIRYSIGTGSTTLRTLATQTYNHSLVPSTGLWMSVCQDSYGVTGSIIGSTWFRAQTSSVVTGKYCGLDFTNMDSTDYLTWQTAVWAKMKNGTTDASCAECTKCEVTDPDTGTVYRIPCYLSVDLTWDTASCGSYGGSCDDSDGTYLLKVGGTKTGGALEVWGTPDGLNYGCSFKAAAAIGKDVGSDSGWYLYVNPCRYSTSETWDTMALHKKSLTDPSDLWSMSFTAIAANADRTYTTCYDCDPGNATLEVSEAE